MIKLIPLEKSEKLNALCSEYSIEYNENIHAYISADESLKAQCVFSLDNYNVELLALETDSTDPLVEELLVRAVGSYSANRSGYIFKVSKELGKKIEATLKTLNFEKDENGYNGKVPKILEGSCRCKNKE